MSLDQSWNAVFVGGLLAAVSYQTLTKWTPMTQLWSGLAGQYPPGFWGWLGFLLFFGLILRLLFATSWMVCSNEYHSRLNAFGKSAPGKAFQYGLCLFVLVVSTVAISQFDDLYTEYSDTGHDFTSHGASLVLPHPGRIFGPLLLPAIAGLLVHAMAAGFLRKDSSDCPYLRFARRRAAGEGVLGLACLALYVWSWFGARETAYRAGFPYNLRLWLLTLSAAIAVVLYMDYRGFKQVHAQEG